MRTKDDFCPNFLFNPNFAKIVHLTQILPYFILILLHFCSCSLHQIQCWDQKKSIILCKSTHQILNNLMSSNLWEKNFNLCKYQHSMKPKLIYFLTFAIDAKCIQNTLQFHHITATLNCKITFWFPLKIAAADN